ncbi:hypothetical protein [Rhizobium leguminosarum]|uniref:hypothetical protein n=1 Tax=Rhizobium leguminosarum TaxID=384 RepID=UPI002E14F1D5|nr:hypothetical protein U8Q02_40255 [Rhizobium leguminosarum]
MSQTAGDETAKKRTKKWETASFVVDGVAIELREIPFRRHQWGHNYDADGHVIGHPMEQKLFEAWIDGNLVGRAAKPHGFGKQTYLLERVGYAPHEHYLEGLGYEEFLGVKASEASKLYDLDKVAARFVEERKKITGTRGQRISSLPTSEELQAYKLAIEAAWEAEEAEQKLSRDKFSRESNERIMREEHSRVDTVGGLQEILETFGSQLSNYQRDALLKAIDKSSTPSGEYTQTMLRKREKEWEESMRANKDV